MKSEQLVRVDNGNRLMEYTANIVSSYLVNNKVPVSDIVDLIEKVYNTLDSKNIPANNNVPMHSLDVKELVANSVTPDYIVCLEDGKKLKMLKRYLKTNYDLTPEEYRKKWGLSLDYPMVAPRYAAIRSKLAKDIGLGRVTTKKVNGQ